MHPPHQFRSEQLAAMYEGLRRQGREVDAVCIVAADWQHGSCSAFRLAWALIAAWARIFGLFLKGRILWLEAERTRGRLHRCVH